MNTYNIPDTVLEVQQRINQTWSQWLEIIQFWKNWNCLECWEEKRGAAGYVTRDADPVCDETLKMNRHCLGTEEGWRVSPASEGTAAHWRPRVRRRTCSGNQAKWWEAGSGISRTWSFAHEGRGKAVLVRPRFLTWTAGHIVVPFMNSGTRGQMRSGERDLRHQRREARQLNRDLLLRRKVWTRERYLHLMAYAC